jgi:hypothetical protein
MCLVRYVTINGVREFTLFDSGSTTNAVSPDFTQVAKLNVKELVKPVMLLRKLFEINFAMTVIAKFASINCNTYLDIANLDKYDCILGTLFLRKHGISLDFDNWEIVIHRKLHIPTLPEGEGEAEAKPIKRNKK